jgi:hypothetical protein
MRIAALAVRASVLLAGSIVSVNVVSASPAFAQPPAPDPKRRTDVLLKEGQELAKANQTEQALSKFEDAYALSPTGIAAYHIARMEEALGRHALALQHYREALRDPNLAAEPRRDAEKAVAELKTKVGVITLDVPAGSTTTVDGNEVDAKTAIEVVPGLHVVKIRLGGESKSVDVTAPAGAVTPVTLRFGDDGKTLGGKPAGEQPAGAIARTSPTVLTTRNVVGGSLGIVGLVAAGIGLGFLIDSNGKVGDAKDYNASIAGGACAQRAAPSCTEYASRLDAATTSRTASYIGLGVGGGFALASIAAFAFWPVALRPVITSRTVGFGADF